MAQSGHLKRDGTREGGIVAPAELNSASTSNRSACVAEVAPHFHGAAGLQFHSAFYSVFISERLKWATPRHDLQNI